MTGAAAAEVEGRRVVRALALAHRCVCGCPACAEEDASSPAIEPLYLFEKYVTSDAAARAARHAKRTGTPFPTVSRDDVTQFCVEEAVFDLLHIRERQAQAEATGGQLETVDESGQLPSWSDPALEHARAFSRGEVDA